MQARWDLEASVWLLYRAIQVIFITTGGHMSPTSARTGREQDFDPSSSRSTGAVRRLTTETKASFKTTEFFAMIGVIVGILVAAASIDTTEGHPDKFIGSQAWLYVAIVASAYMISRGLSKSGSRESYTDGDGS
jgi:hypothetical protein